MTTIKFPVLVFLIVIAGITVYSNSLGNAFVWDDNFFVVTNDFIKDLKLIPAYFTLPQAVGNSDFGQIYRPVTILSYAFDYSVWKLNPMGYHITNLALHIGNAVLVFYLLTLIIKDRFIAFFAAMIFLTHPVQTESVSWISGRSNVLFLSFFLLALISYIKYTRLERPHCYVFSLLCFTCALFSKEMAATLPFVCMLYDRVRHRRENLLSRVGRYSPFFVVLGVYVFVRNGVIGKFSEAVYCTGDFYTTFLTMLKGLVHYIRLLFCPVGLCAEYFTFPISASIREPAVLISSGVIAGFLVLSYISSKKMKYVSFSILWFFITLGPVLNIIPINVLIAERFLYLPMVGYAMAVAVIFRFLYIKFRRNQFLRPILVLSSAMLIVIYASLTMARNTVWADEVSIFEDVVKKYPDNYRIYSNLGFAYLSKKGMDEMAFKALKRSLDLNPDFFPARNMMALYFFRAGKYDESITQLEHALTIVPDNDEIKLRIEEIKKIKNDK